MLDQVPKLLGIHFPKAGFFANLLAIVHRVPEASLPTLMVGIATIGLLVALERALPRVPAPLVIVAAGIAAMGLLGLQASGVEAIGAFRAACRPSHCRSSRSSRRSGREPWASRS